jgi:protein XagA
MHTRSPAARRRAFFRGLPRVDQDRIAREVDRVSRSFKALLLTVVLGCALPARVHAGAWTLEASTGQLILATTYYHADDLFTRGSNRRPFPNDGEFSKVELNPYLEYGLLNDLTLVSDFFLRYLESSDRSGSDTNFGFADPEIGLRYRLSPPDWTTVWSVQGLVKLPVSSSSDRPALSNKQTDLEARLLVGRGFSLGSGSAFWNVELAYRYRNGGPADEIRLDGTFGYYPAPKWLLMAQFFGIQGLRNAASTSAGSNPTIQPDYDLYKGQVSVVYQLTPAVRAQIGYARDLYGRNTGAGNAVVAALWFKF